MHQKVKSIEAWATEKAEQKFIDEMVKLESALRNNKVLSDSKTRVFLKISTEGQSNHLEWKQNPTIQFEYLFSTTGVLGKTLKDELVAKWREEILAGLLNKIEGIDDQLEGIRNEIYHIHRNQ